ncbi:MAG: XRE family transcriptional regulator [Chloroflexus sp.]|uniref:helix-turn-helix domain-containing protein n=1 Tax=Chloroflexus sp. TaxID=1904827 RepID=UPI0030A97228
MISQRLRQLRLARGMTLSDLAQATNHIVTRQAISKYEHGHAQPSPTVLQRLAQALGVRPTDLLDGYHIRVEIVAYRKRASLGKRQSEHLAALAEEALRERVRLQRLIGDTRTLDVPLQEYPVRSPDDVESAAADLRNRWDLGSAPIANLTDVLEDHGLHVIELATIDGFDGVAVIARDEHGHPLAAAVIAQRSDDGARWRMNLAHELAHLVLQPQDNLDEEKAAFRFAAAFLAPAHDLRAFIGERRHHLHLDELLLMKHHFGMSIQALLYRMQTLDIISPSLFRKWMIEFGERGWRMAEPEPLPHEEPLWLRRATLHALAEELIDPAEAQRLLGDEVATGVAQAVFAETVIPETIPETIQAEDVPESHYPPPPPAHTVPCRQLLRLPQAERHAILAAQAANALDLYQSVADSVNEVATSEHK